MINTGATRGIYRHGLFEDVIGYRAVGKLTSKALHDPRIDKEAFHPLHWRYLRRGCYVRGVRQDRFYRANLKDDLHLFDLTPEDIS